MRFVQSTDFNGYPQIKEEQEVHVWFLQNILQLLFVKYVLLFFSQDEMADAINFLRGLKKMSHI